MRTKIFKALALCLGLLAQTAQANPGDVLHKFEDHINIFALQVISQYDVSLTSDHKCVSSSASCHLFFPYDGSCGGNLDNPEIKDLPMSKCSGLILDQKIDALMKAAGHPDDCSGLKLPADASASLDGCNCVHDNEKPDGTGSVVQASFSECISAFPAEMRDQILKLEEQVNGSSDN